ncbi:DNA-binding transcriptional MerR regulator [Marmoricola sp. OAE513]|uniref:heavy metal-responsive transcriptional regulator n=1 Tax=Marmoricola sp. OAE513 TaxID=2817894 RepID=UPI001AE3456A
MLISDLAGAAGVKTSTVRFYERKGILASPQRTTSGYREYDDADVDRLRFLKRGQELGFTLAELRAMTSFSGTAGPLSGEISALGTAKLAEIDERIADLARVRGALAGLLEAQCIEPDVPCPIIQALAQPRSSLSV